VIKDREKYKVKKSHCPRRSSRKREKTAKNVRFLPPQSRKRKQKKIQKIGTNSKSGVKET